MSSMSQGVRIDRPVPAELANATALEEDGRVVSLGALWAERAVVLAFVRHFG
jgi:hypothetical protein